MESQELQTLGFATDNPTKLLTAAVATGNVRGMQKVPGFDLIGVFTDPSGARLSLVRRKGHDVRATPSLASSETHRAAVYRVGDHLAHASLFIGDDETVEVIVSVDDPTQYPERTEKDPDSFAIIQALTLGAIGLRADVYADEADFEENRPEQDREWSSRALASPSVAVEPILSKTEISARAYASFVVESAWKRKNELTGREFWYGIGLSRVRLAFALPASMELQPGNVVIGTFTLTASSGLWDRA
jgi:hypothetical protein